jgi:hypothetical protein
LKSLRKTAAFGTGRQYFTEWQSEDPSVAIQIHDTKCNTYSNVLCTCCFLLLYSAPVSNPWDMPAETDLHNGKIRVSSIKVMYVRIMSNEMTLCFKFSSSFVFYSIFVNFVFVFFHIRRLVSSCFTQEAYLPIFFDTDKCVFLLKCSFK